MLNHVMQIQVGLAGSQRYNCHSVKKTGEVASADNVAVKSGCQSPNPRNTLFQMGILCSICVSSSRM